MDGPWSGCADDLFINDELPDHTAESGEDIILSNAASLDETLAEDRYKHNLRKLEVVPSIRRYGSKDDSHRWFSLERSLAGPGTSEAAPLEREQQSGTSAGCRR